MSVVIGIDPGTHTGLAIFRDGKLAALRTIAPIDLEQEILVIWPSRVVFEDSRLQSHAWTTAKTRAAAVKMARNVGEIDAWCKLIVAICEKHGIPAHGISPRVKGSKLDAAQFAAKTGWAERNNQHERDAAAVAWMYRGAK